MFERIKELVGKRIGEFVRKHVIDDVNSRNTCEYCSGKCSYASEINPAKCARHYDSSVVVSGTTNTCKKQVGNHVH